MHIDLSFRLMKIALYQGPGHINNVPASFALMAAKAQEAKAQGAELAAPARDVPLRLQYRP